MHNKATFVIPLGAGSTWENNELRYMLRSLEKYCQFDYEVVLYATKKIEWVDCRQVTVKRTYPKELFEFFNYQKKCDEFYLEVRCSNTEAVRLYEKLGFAIKQQLNVYYRDGEDAFLMAIELGK